MGAENTKKELNGEQRAAAYCPENAVIAAGAGSGKTMVLASRFVWLLTEKDYHVDEILTLTFTRKAAAQMYRRIYTVLSETAAADTGEKGQRARKALDDFVHARIQTLDSYSTALVKQAAPRYGISPEFTVDNDRCRELANEEALPFFIAHRHHPAIERLYLQQGPEGIVDGVFASALSSYSFIDEVSDLRGDIKKQFDIICAEWKEQSGRMKDALGEMGDLIADNKALLPELVPLLTPFNSGKIVFPEESEIRSYFDFLLTLPEESFIEKAEAHPLQEAILKTLEFIAAINALSLQKGKRHINPVKEKIKVMRNVFGSFSSLVVFCMQAGLILSVMSLVQKLQRSYLDKKRAEGILTFTDVARLARTILRDQPDIRQNEKEAFKAIIIDEFQDNNELQKELLFLLAEKPELSGKGIPKAEDLSPGKLFFVGDEKQSVYRFRGADVSVFRKLKDELGSDDLPLKINYRSSPKLIGAFNAIFGGSVFDPLGEKPLNQYDSVFAPQVAAGGAVPQSLPLFEAAYSPLRAGKDTEGRLTLCILNKKGEAEEDSEGERLAAVENEARFIAERIKLLLEMKNPDQNPKYQPDDIAVLFRTHTPQHQFEKHLRLLNIPYSCEYLNGFFYGGPVNDMMSVLRLAAYPLDTEAYAEMLRSPFAGLSLQGLAICLASFGEEEKPLPFGDHVLSLLGEADSQKFKCGQEVYNRICGKSLGESISSLISELWYTLGYRYETAWNSQTAVYQELYDYLFHLAAKADADNLSLAAFTDSIQDLRESDERIEDIEIPLERPSAVHLMTVHKSKGLEFPVVFLCCCGGTSRKGGPYPDVYDTGSCGISFTPPIPPACSGLAKMRRDFFREKSVTEEKQKRTAELRRLLYVAMTRAENELYLSGCLDLGETEDEGDDFSLVLKTYVNAKMEKAEEKNSIPGDTILDNDTFFGLCLPAFAAHISDEGLEEKESFFNLEAIPVYTDEDIHKKESLGAVFSNDQKGLLRFFEKAEPFYNNAEILRTPLLENNHKTPSSFHESPDTKFDENAFVLTPEYGGADSADIFGKVDAILSRFTEQEKEGREKFNAANFGTLAHACVEALLNGQEAEMPPKLGGSLSPSEAEALLKAGKELARRFIQSPLGKIAEKAELRKSEFPFRTLIKNPLPGQEENKDLFISGTIDLLFSHGETVHVVDFKSDSRENPIEHAAQMAFYYQAASSLFCAGGKKKCRVWLYYLRTGHALEMTQGALFLGRRLSLL